MTDPTDVTDPTDPADVTDRPQRLDAEVVVVGGGTAGLQAAHQLAQAGRSVVLLERRAQDRGGARWWNGVLDWQFERAGLAPPAGDERRDGTGVNRLFSPSGQHHFTLPDNPVVEADMRRLGERLRGLAEESGAQLVWEAKDLAVELDAADRPAVVRATTPSGPIEVRPQLVVDASGYRGVVRSQIPELARHCPPAAASDLCSAQQLMLAIDDDAGAKDFLDRHGAQVGDAVVTVGVDGGYSTINIQVEPGFEQVSVLVGTMPEPGDGTNGVQLLRAVRAAEPWIGRPLDGGGGLIPVRRTYHRFTAPGVALVGDSAAQVMAGHGSGIGFGLIAGRVLAEAVADAADPGDPDVLWRYQARFLREFGATLAAYDAVRRMSIALGRDGIDALFATGIFSPSLVRPGLDQRIGRLGAREAVEAARTLTRRRDLARIVVPALGAMGLARPLYRTYPAERSESAFARWAASVDRVLPTQPT